MTPNGVIGVERVKMMTTTTLKKIYFYTSLEIVDV